MLSRTRPTPGPAASSLCSGEAGSRAKARNAGFPVGCARRSRSRPEIIRIASRRPRTSDESTATDGWKRGSSSRPRSESVADLSPETSKRCPLHRDIRDDRVCRLPHHEEIAGRLDCDRTGFCSPLRTPLDPEFEPDPRPVGSESLGENVVFEGPEARARPPRNCPRDPYRRVGFACSPSVFAGTGNSRSDLRAGRRDAGRRRLRTSRPDRALPDDDEFPVGFARDLRAASDLPSCSVHRKR